MIEYDRKGPFIIHPFEERHRVRVDEVPVDYDTSLWELWNATTSQTLYGELSSKKYIESFRDKAIGSVSLALARVSPPEHMTIAQAQTALESAGFALPDLRTGLSYLTHKVALGRRRPTVRQALYGQGETFISDAQHTRNPYETDAMVWRSSQSFFHPWSVDHNRINYDKGFLVVCNSDAVDYTTRSGPPQAVPSSAEAQQLLQSTRDIKSGKKHVHRAIERIMGLTRHPDPVITRAAITRNAALGTNARYRYNWYEIGGGLGHPDASVRQLAADTMLSTKVKSWQGKHITGVATMKALLYHADKITAELAPPLFAAALEWISSPPPTSDNYRGSRRARNHQGYALMTLLTRSNDESVSQDAVLYLTTCLYGADPSETIASGPMLKWLEDNLASSDSVEEWDMWQGFRTIMEGKRFSHRTEEAYHALQPYSHLIPHRALRELAELGLTDYEEAKKKTGIYFEFS